MTTGTTTPDVRSTTGAGSVRRQLRELAATAATGRLALLGDGGGWIHLQDGDLSCAERTARPTLLVAMGEAGLFTAEEWATTLRLPSGPRWSALVGGDADRLRGLAAFARTYVVQNVGALLEAADRHPGVATTFTRDAAHPFGPIDRWPVEDVLAGVPTAPQHAAPALDRTEFLELLEEVSPHVRRVGDGRLCVVDVEGSR